MKKTKAQEHNDHLAVALSAAVEVLNDCKFLYAGEIYFTDTYGGNTFNYALAYVPNAQGVLLQVQTGADDEGNAVYTGVAAKEWTPRIWALALSHMQGLYDACKKAPSPEEDQFLADALASVEDFIQRRGRTFQ